MLGDAGDLAMADPYGRIEQQMVYTARYLCENLGIEFDEQEWRDTWQNRR